MHALGFGYFRTGKSGRVWSQDACDWLDKYTYYRSRNHIFSALKNHIGAFERYEPEYLAYRLKSGMSAAGRRNAGFATRLVRSAATFLVERLAGLVLVAERGRRNEA
jgi:hypothetical protein